MRINGNAVRLRLNQSEFEAFMEYGSIADIIELPNGPISYGLEKCGESELNVTRRADSIRIGMPEKMVLAWKDPNEVGFSHVQNIQGKAIEITVEKELKCPTPNDCKADEDAFPRPE